MADNINKTQILFSFYIKDADTREIPLDSYLLTKNNLCDENTLIKKLVVEWFKVKHNIFISKSKLRVVWPYNVNTLQEFRNLPSILQEIHVYVGSRYKEDEIKQKLKADAPPKTDSNIGTLPTTDLDIDDELDQRHIDEIEAMRLEADMRFKAMEDQNKMDRIDAMRHITNMEEGLHIIRDMLSSAKKEIQTTKSKLDKAYDKIDEANCQAKYYSCKAIEYSRSLKNLTML